MPGAPFTDRRPARVLTCGSVDDGKSTLLGRLLLDTSLASPEHLDDARGPHDELDLARFTDGLRSERTEGITVDVAWRHLSLRPALWLLDSPGHEGLTRNLICGASHADAAVLLVDVTRGLRGQTRRHLELCALLGVPRLIVAINKMDRLDYARRPFEALRDEVLAFAAQAAPTTSVEVLPISALAGENVANRSSRMSAFAGPCLLERLLEVEPARLVLDEPRVVVQWVSTRTGRAKGALVAGHLRPGTQLRREPSGDDVTVDKLFRLGQERVTLRAPAPIEVELEVGDLKRGDLLVARDSPVRRTSELSLTLCAVRDVEPGRPLRIKHGSRIVPVTELDVANNGIAAHAVASAHLRLAAPLHVDPYGVCPATGGVVLLDAGTGDTLAAGLCDVELPEIEGRP